MTVAGFTYDAPTTTLYRLLTDDLNEKRRRGLEGKAVLDALVDEMAYTWFNRLTALRFMEVNGYALRALSSSTPGLVDPDLLQNATTLVSGGEFAGVTLDDLDRWRKGGDEAVYCNLLVAQCRKLAGPLPFLFGAGKSYAALFLPDNLLTGGLVVRFEDGELRLSTRKIALRRAQERVRRYVPEGVSLADELIAERREEAAKE